MSRQTFEQALRTTLANCRLARILDGELSSHNWNEALVEDIKDVEKIIDHLCSDLTLLTGRPIQRFTKLRPQIMVHMIGGTEEDVIRFTLHQLSKSIKAFLRHTIGALRCDPRGDGMFTYPINSIFWNKEGAWTNFPDSIGRVQSHKVLEPEKVSPDTLDQPRHIRTLLSKCRQTHFDYRPYVLKDRRCKILALELGCDWHDLAVATWNNHTQNAFCFQVAFLAICCFMLMTLGLYWSFVTEEWWIRFLLMVGGVVVGVLGGLISSLLVALFFKPLKV